MDKIDKQLLRLQMEGDQLWMELRDRLGSFWEAIKYEPKREGNNVILPEEIWQYIAFAATLAIGDASIKSELEKDERDIC